MALSRMDADIRQDVNDALANDTRISNSSMSVDVVGGTVFLRGMVPNYHDKLIAAEIVNRIKGVIDVQNDLRVAPPSPRTDIEITADVQASLRRDVWVDEDKVSVTTTNGVVYLTGTVDSYTEKSYAENDSFAVPGVREVVNSVVIMPTPIRPDSDIKRSVEDDLARNIRIDPVMVRVDVAKGTVYLRGNVSTVPQKWLAEELAWWTSGVREVVNELRIAA